MYEDADSILENKRFKPLWFINMIKGNSNGVQCPSSHSMEDGIVRPQSTSLGIVYILHIASKLSRTC